MTQKTLSLKVWITFVFLVTTVFTSSAFAQFDKGQVSGFVHDAKDAAVQRAVVKAVNAATKTEYETVTADSGYFVFTNLMPGKYQLLPGTRQANPGINPDALRPYKGFGVIRLSENAGRSEYHGLQVSVGRRFHKGLGFGLAYSLSRLTDDASNRRERLFNAYDASGFRGISSDDRTHCL